MKRKTDFLKGLDTKSLVSKMQQYENELEQRLLQESNFKRQNAEYLSSYSSDCRAVDYILASLDPPEGKMTVDQRKLWLTKQRTTYPELRDAISNQYTVAFQNDQNHIEVEMLVKRLEGIHIVLALKTAQIKFLTGEG